MSHASPIDPFNTPATELAEAIRSGRARSRDIIDAHIGAIDRLNPALGAIVATRHDEARAEADEIDAFVRDGKADTLGPLAGVPCTIKEAFALEGMPHSSGLVARRDIRATSDATTVGRLRGAGAIPLGVTNTSELCMWMETSNRLYGRTNNPHNLGHIVGGSSGGEGAAVAAGLSPIGLGSDVGGSIRMPAFFNGVYGHKPSGGLVPATGQFPGASGDVLRYLTTGPITRYATDLMPFLRVVAGPDGHDEGCAPFELGDPGQVDLRGLRVTTIETNGLRRVSKELLRAQRRVASALAEAGAEVHHAELPLLRESLHLWSGLLARGGGPTFSELMGNGPPLPVASALANWLTRRGDHTIPGIALAWLESVPFLTSPGDDTIVDRMGELRAAVDALLGDNGVILFPSYTRAAPRHLAPLFTPIDWTYTAIVNVLELPATQIPVGLNQRSLPLGVQVVGPHGKDHIPIAVAMALERRIGGSPTPRGVWAGRR